MEGEGVKSERHKSSPIFIAARHSGKMTIKSTITALKDAFGKKIPHQIGLILLRREVD